MLSKSLIQLSLEGQGCIPSLLFDLRPKYGNKDNVNLLQKVPPHTATLRAPNPAAGHHQPTPPPKTPGHSQATLGQSLVGSLLLSPGSQCIRFSLCPPRVYFQVLCKFWQLYGGVNGDLLQVGLCHNQVYCTQSPCPCGRPLLIHASTGGTQTP